MAAPANYVKIGLLAVLGLVAAAALAVTVGVRSARRNTVAYFTYFTEAVTGLSVGSPVKARGVDVGTIGEITFAPDRKMIEIRMDIERGMRDRFRGFGEERESGLRAQMASQGLTGGRFIAIDFFDPKANPPPVLSFLPPARYIPSTTSDLKTIEDSVTTAMNGLARLVTAVSEEGMLEKSVLALTSANGLLTSGRQFVDQLQRQDIPRQARATADGARAALEQLSRALERLDGETGLIATTQRSVSAFGDVGRNTTGATRDLGPMLDELREAAAAVRRLADELEREPDMLLKGRGKASLP